MKTELNQLELALLDPSDDRINTYLEIESTDQIRADIEQIRKRAALSTDAGKLRERILEALEDAE